MGGRQGMSDDVIHISPINDLVEHELEGEDCVCGPDVEPVMRSDGSNGWIVRHHSLDGREVWEEKDSEGAAPESSVVVWFWGVIRDWFALRALLRRSGTEDNPGVGEQQ